MTSSSLVSPEQGSLHTVTLRPGRWGSKIAPETGRVESIVEGGQTFLAGVQVGWKICHIDSANFDFSLLKQKAAGNTDYLLTFSNAFQDDVPKSDESVPAPPAANFLRLSSHRQRRRGKRAALDELLGSGSSSVLLPSRASTLDPHCMLAKLPTQVAEAVVDYCSLIFGKHSDEIAPCLTAAAETCPEGLRVKELLESFEVYHEVAAFVHDAGKERPIDTIYDLACGHGLVGLLLAYRFPGRTVICIDKTKRKVFDALLDGFRAHGSTAPGESEPLSNLRFMEEDIATLQLPSSSIAVAVHACNELNRQILDAAKSAGAAWAVLPCCVRAGTYLPCRVGGTLTQDDDAKHILNCGIVAGLYGAERLQAIDRRITNRNLLICGGADFGSYEEACRRCASGGS